MALYKIARSICATIFYPRYRIKVEGKENIPEKGPVVICSNHISNFDPIVVGITAPRDIYFMAKEELFKNKFIGGLLKRIHAFPVKRGMKDRQALRKAMGVLEDNEVLGLFPEGTRSKTGELKKGLAGAGFFALRSEATVIPCAIVGSYKGKEPLRVIYGKPVPMAELRERKASSQEVTDVIMGDIQKLLDKKR
ncbi:acyl-phosphate glycerol 3-phosphate acyltransferase [Pontibacillus chungwhensis BH030062]|uniref:Acyl-phosphate glycerol 3-phosphate acyltransferase n=1 Tax=Pontibacillus chungwhensis BH030062 TaxID=1385513 RepID=A0A0A2V258_9BACI|nr:MULTISPECIES: lysophospholipid acyltransferase family protein [Pontibacillus]KGP93148.1 acyl-phosphate glycerol 3-phosphate acyltransferase [Pontibacillus chungwhensis BH030062]QSS98483.1 1-acyl-sn-glycerol-3-phosphate acyltransferase [Pontibacillus sp. ALD_SL1]